MAKEVVLPSGRKLEITMGSFVESKALYTAAMEELKGIKLDPNAEVDVNLYKDMFCAALSSRKIEQAMDALLKRCTYDGLRIVADTFEPEEARGDYLEVMFYVAEENIKPFTKNLYAKFGAILPKLKGSPA